MINVSVAPSENAITLTITVPDQWRNLLRALAEVFNSNNPAPVLRLITHDDQDRQPPLPQQPRRMSGARERAETALAEMVAAGETLSARRLAKWAGVGRTTAATVLSGHRSKCPVTVRSDTKTDTPADTDYSLNPEGNHTDRANTDQSSRCPVTVRSDTKTDTRTALIPDDIDPDFPDWPHFKCSDGLWTVPPKLILRLQYDHPDADVEATLRRLQRYTTECETESLKTRGGMAKRCRWWVEQSKPGGKMWAYGEKLRRDAQALVASAAKPPQDIIAQRAAILGTEDRDFVRYTDEQLRWIERIESDQANRQRAFGDHPNDARPPGLLPEGDSRVAEHGESAHAARLRRSHTSTLVHVGGAFEGL